MTKATISNNKANECEVMISVTCFLFSSPSERTADDLEIIYEELLHIKALSHLSTTVSEGCHCADMVVFFSSMTFIFSSSMGAVAQLGEWVVQ